MSSIAVDSEKCAACVGVLLCVIKPLIYDATYEGNIREGCAQHGQVVGVCDV